jgi:hypothetical protein
MQNNNNDIQGELIEQVKNFFPEFKDNLDFDCLEYYFDGIDLIFSIELRFNNNVLDDYLFISLESHSTKNNFELYVNYHMSLTADNKDSEDPYQEILTKELQSKEINIIEVEKNYNRGEYKRNILCPEVFLNLVLEKSENFPDAIMFHVKHIMEENSFKLKNDNEYTRLYNIIKSIDYFPYESIRNKDFFEYLYNNFIKDGVVFEKELAEYLHLNYGT